MGVKVRMGSFSVLPAGRYAGVISDVEIAEGKKSEYQLLKFRINTEDANGKPCKLFAQYSFHPNAVGYIKKMLKAVEVAFEETEEVADDGSKIKALEFEPDDLAGLSVIAVVVVEQYESTDKNTVKDVLLDK